MTKPENPYNPDDLVGGLSVAPMSAREMEKLLHDVWQEGFDACIDWKEEN